MKTNKQTTKRPKNFSLLLTAFPSEVHVVHLQNSVTLTDIAFHLWTSVCFDTWTNFKPLWKVLRPSHIHPLSSSSSCCILWCCWSKDCIHSFIHSFIHYLWPLILGRVSEGLQPNPADIWRERKNCHHHIFQLTFYILPPAVAGNVASVRPCDYACCHINYHPLFYVACFRKVEHTAESWLEAKRPKLSSVLHPTALK